MNGDAVSFVLMKAFLGCWTHTRTRTKGGGTKSSLLAALHWHTARDINASPTLPPPNMITLMYLGVLSSLSVRYTRMTMRLNTHRSSV